MPKFRPTLTRYTLSLIAPALFAATLWLYVASLAPSVVTMFDDSLEFQLVSYQLGIAHPTGYPLYTLLGKLFSLLPVGNIAYRVNLLSAVLGAATVTLLYGLTGQISREMRPLFPSLASSTPAWAKNELGPAHAAGLVSALFLAGSWVFWGQATIAEVYTLNAFFMVALLYLTVSSGETGQLERRILGLAFVAGLALTHHRTILLLWPALALYLLHQLGSRLWRPRLIFSALLVGTLPLLLYLYLPLRGHIGSLDGTYENSWAGFWRHVSGGGYGSTFILGNPLTQQRDVAFYWDLLAGQFYTPFLAVLGFLFLLWRGPSRLVGLTGVAFLTYLGFNIFYQVSDIEVFFIPIFVLWALWSGLGLAGVFQLAASLPAKWWRFFATVLVTILLLGALGQQFRANQARATAGYTWQIHDYGLDMLQQPLPSAEAGGTTIIGILGEMTLIRYFQQTIGRRPDIETVAADLEVDRLAAVERALQRGRAVYLTRQLPGAAERWSLSAVGPLIRVNPQPLTDPALIATLQPQPLALMTEISLLGYQLSRPPHTGSGPAPVRLTLFWQAVAPRPADLKVSARLLNPAGAIVAVIDAGPVHFAYPTSAWRSGEIVADVYDLPLPVDFQPDQPLIPLLIWYDPAQNAAEVGRAELAPIQLE